MTFLVLPSISRDETPRSHFDNIRQGTGRLVHCQSNTTSEAKLELKNVLLTSDYRSRASSWGILDKMVDKPTTLRLYLEALGL